MYYSVEIQKVLVPAWVRVRDDKGDIIARIGER